VVVLTSTGLNLPVDYSVDVDKRKGIYLQVNTGSFLHYYVLGGALLVILHYEVLFVCFDKFTAIFLVVCLKQALVLEKIKKYKDIHKQVTWTNAQF